MTDTPADQQDLPGHIEDTVRALANLNAEHHLQAPPLQRVVDRAVLLIARPGFVSLLTAFILIWIGLNAALGTWGGRWGERTGFDPPPFLILQGMAQFAALYITVLILITQRHKSELTDHREQLTLELVMLSEQKSAKIVELIEELRRDSPTLKDRIDHQADALSVPADPRQVFDAIKEKHGEMLAIVKAEIAGRSPATPDEQGT